MPRPATESPPAPWGFTGTRLGMTPPQREAVRGLLAAHAPACVHHGDCRGADQEFHEDCLLTKEKRALWLVVHPPADIFYRAFCKEFDQRRSEKPFLQRNREIVDACGIVVAAPADMAEPPLGHGGGTWHTIRYARRQRKKIYLVLPDGTIQSEPPYPVVKSPVSEAVAIDF